MQTLQERFPYLLTILEVDLLPVPIEWDNTTTLSHSKNFAMNIGDVLIYETCKKFNIDLMVTTDKDWERMDIEILLI